MDYNSIIKNQTYLFEAEKDLFSENNQIIYKICENASLPKPSYIEFITSTIEYDLYKVRCDTSNYVIKYSLDEFDSSLEYEFNIINNINETITYKPIYYNKFHFGDFIHYSIYLDKKFESIKDFGIGIIYEKKELFMENYYSLQKSSKPKIKHKENIENFINQHSINFFDDDVIESIKQNLDIEKLKILIESIHSEMFLLFSLNIFNKNEFCHGNLNANNIFYCYEGFKFFNLSNAFSGNAYCDLASLVINLSLNKNIEKTIFNFLIKKAKKESVVDEWVEYRKCFDFISRKIFLELLFSYLKEVYLFESKRPIKLFEIIEIFSQNKIYFSKIQAVSNNFEFINNLLLQPLIGKDH